MGRNGDDAAGVGVGSVIKVRENLDFREISG
jgi:hypothetical protein